jgi:hypothetical protein
MGRKWRATYHISWFWPAPQQHKCNTFTWHPTTQNWQPLSKNLHIEAPSVYLSNGTVLGGGLGGLLWCYNRKKCQVPESGPTEGPITGKGIVDILTNPVYFGCSAALWGMIWIVSISVATCLDWLLICFWSFSKLILLGRLSMCRTRVAPSRIPLLTLILIGSWPPLIQGMASTCVC